MRLHHAEVEQQRAVASKEFDAMPSDKVVELAAELINDNPKDLAGAYTNRDIWELFQPDGDWIPYVYDQLENWGECDWDPLSYPMNSTR